MLSNCCFWFAALVALGAAVLAISRRQAVHGLLWLVLSLLAVAVLFFMLGAPFAAALEVIVYAGAIMVLFLFAVMMMRHGAAAPRQEAQWLAPGVWIAPGLLALGLAADLMAIARLAGDAPVGAAVIPPGGRGQRAVWPLPHRRGAGLGAALGRGCGGLSSGPTAAPAARGGGRRWLAFLLAMAWCWRPRCSLSVWLG